jgi:hypothetical protein
MILCSTVVLNTQCCVSARAVDPDSLDPDSLDSDSLNSDPDPAFHVNPDTDPDPIRTQVFDDQK